MISAVAGRGRDASCLAPPAQNRTCGFPAYGSHLGSRRRTAAAMRRVRAPAPVSHESGTEPGVCVAGAHSPWPRPFAPPAPSWITPLCSPASQLLWPRPTSCIRTSSATAPRLPDADLGAICHRSNAGSPSFRHAPSARDVLFDPGRVAAPRITVPLMLRSAAKESLRPNEKGISGLNHTPRAVAVYASWPSLPPVTQHSLPGGSLRLTWAGLSPADRASLLAHPLPTLPVKIETPPPRPRRSTRPRRRRARRP